MFEFLGLSSEFIRNDLLIGFGLYSVLFFCLKLFGLKSTFLSVFDRNAIRVVIFLGCLLFCFNIIVYILGDYASMETRSGPFIRGAFYIQTFFWLLLTQLLWFRFFENSIIYRVLMSSLCFLTFERFIIIVTSLHRDYLPGDSFSTRVFEMISLTDIIFGLSLKLLTFIMIVGIYQLGRNVLVKFINR